MQAELVFGLSQEGDGPVDYGSTAADEFIAGTSVGLFSIYRTDRCIHFNNGIHSSLFLFASLLFFALLISCLALMSGVGRTRANLCGMSRWI